MEFARKRTLWFIISLVIIIPGIISLLLNGLNFGIDFTSGNLIQVEFEQEAQVADIRESIANSGVADFIVQESDNNEFIIKTRVMSQDQENIMIAALQSDIGALDIMRSEAIGPTIGAELRRAGMISLFLALTLMVIYITIRFELFFAMAAIIALVHDVLVTVGIFSLLQFEVNAEFIAAVLLVVGYSINATIVIFDRIRENLGKAKKEPMEDIINLSINQTLTRSINTTLTVLFVIVALLIFGGETIRNFNIVLFVGVLSGFYSSVFLAGPLWLVVRKLKQKKA